MRIKTSLHGDRADMWYVGERAGLSGETVLDTFSRALHNVEFELDVDEATGKATIVTVDGRPLARAPLPGEDQTIELDVERRRRMTEAAKVNGVVPLYQGGRCQLCGSRSLGCEAGRCAEGRTIIGVSSGVYHSREEAENDRAWREALEQKAGISRID